MKATKFILTITVEALSKDCFPALIQEAIIQLQREKPAGELCCDDGDTVAWGTDEKPVEF